MARDARGTMPTHVDSTVARSRNGMAALRISENSKAFESLRVAATHKAQISKSRAFHTKLSPRPSLPRTLSFGWHYLERRVQWWRSEYM